MWPAAVMTAMLWLTRDLAPAGFFGVALQLAAGGVVYAVLFLAVAIGAAERRLYWTKLRSLAVRQRRTPAAV